MGADDLLNLRKFLAPEIVFGTGALKLAGQHATNLGATKVLVVTDAGVQGAGWTAKVEESLVEMGLPFITYDRVTPNPKDHEVMAGAELYEQEACDLIMAVGGGSPMDCAKGIGVVAGNQGHIVQFEGIDEVNSPGPPFIFVPTTAGSAAEVSQFAIITDTARHLKIAIISKMVMPDIALVDPQTTITMSPSLTAATGMDALCHAFEAFVSNAASPLTDMAALNAAQLIAENLQGAYRSPNDMHHRGNMMMASMMAGLAFSSASLGLVHAMAHSLGGWRGLAHGECNAVLLEQVVRYNYRSASEKYDRLARAMGIEIDDVDPRRRAARIADHLACLRAELGITQRLGEMGVDRSDIARLAASAASDPCMATNPCSASVADIAAIYTDIYQ